FEVMGAAKAGSYLRDCLLVLFRVRYLEDDVVESAPDDSRLQRRREVTRDRRIRRVKKIVVGTVVVGVLLLFRQHTDNGIRHALDQERRTHSGLAVVELLARGVA